MSDLFECEIPARQRFTGARLALLFLALVIPIAGYAQDAPPLAETCVACHGQNGNSVNPEWPSLAGQNTVYLEQQMRAFRDGERANELMAPFIQNLSDDDIADLAAYYSSQPVKAAASGDAGLVSAGQNLAATCSACHGYLGRTANSEWPNLAGQQAQYLVNQMVAIRDGERIAWAMAPMLSGLDDEDFEALAAYYSQLK